jgi:hypothetical protein
MKNLNLLEACSIVGSNVKINAPKRLSNFVKGKAPMVQDNEGYILYPANYPEHKIRRIHAKKTHSVFHHAFMYKNEASSSRQSTHVKYVGGKHKGSKTCVWVPKVLVSNVKGPKTVWVPKNKA